MDNGDMSDVIKNLSGMLNNANIPDNVMDMLNNLQSSNNPDTTVSSDPDVSSNSSSSGISPEVFEKLSGLLNGDNNNGNNGSSTTNSDNNSGIDMETLLKISSIINKLNNSQNDARSNLLLSLKPYLKDSRKSKLDQYIKLLNMSKVLEVMNPNDSKKVK